MQYFERSVTWNTELYHHHPTPTTMPSAGDCSCGSRRSSASVVILVQEYEDDDDDDEEGGSVSRTRTDYTSPRSLLPTSTPDVASPTATAVAAVPSSSSLLETQKQKLEHRRERKAARTLAIITGCFILCWLPFFIQALVVPFCSPECVPPPLVGSVLLWLGYFNSLLNPVIYTIFSPEFRNAFNKILFGRYQRTKRRH